MHGERQGEPRFRMAWSKVTKRYDAEPVPVVKNYSYLRQMSADVVTKAEKGIKQYLGDSTRHVMAPTVRPPRQEVWTRRKELSRFKKSQ